MGLRSRLKSVFREENFVRVGIIHPNKIGRVEARSLLTLFKLFFRPRLSCKPGIRFADCQRNANNNQNKHDDACAEPAEQGYHPADKKARNNAAAFEQLPLGKEAVDLDSNVGKVNTACPLEKGNIHKR